MKKPYVYPMNAINGIILSLRSDDKKDHPSSYSNLEVERSFEYEELMSQREPIQLLENEIYLHEASLEAHDKLEEISKSNEYFEDMVPFSPSLALEGCIRKFLELDKNEHLRVDVKIKKVYKQINIKTIRDDEDIVALKLRRKDHPTRYFDETTPYFNVREMKKLFLDAEEDPVSRRAFFRLIHIALRESYFGDDLDRHQIPFEVIEMAGDSFSRFKEIKPKRGRKRIEPDFKAEVASQIEYIMEETGRAKSRNRQDNKLETSAIDVFVECWNKVSEVCEGKNIVEIRSYGGFTREEDILGPLEKLTFRRVETWLEDVS